MHEGARGFSKKQKTKSEYIERYIERKKLGKENL